MAETISSPSPSIIEKERDEELTEELRTVISGLHSRHMDRVKAWYPHDLVPYEQAKNFRDEPWDESQYPMSDGTRSAILVNLLTEDNLPWYTEMLAGLTDSDHPLHDWVRRWTAEENRHSIAMREWVHATRALNPTLLEDNRMEQIESASVPRMQTVTEMLAYTSLQERATGVAHRNVGTKLTQLDREEDLRRNGGQVMARLAGDENHHHNFYTDALKAALQIDPSTVLMAIAQQLRNFSMPGKGGIPDFAVHEGHIAKEGIYDLAAFRDQVAAPTLKHLEIDSIREESLSKEGSKARAQIHRRMKVLARGAVAMTT